MIEVAVFGTIAASLAAWAAAEFLHSRAFWTVGSALATAHSAAAFAVFHDWSHDRALIATALQTAAVTGLDWGGGLFFNYAFLLVWGADVMWWWIAIGVAVWVMVAVAAALIIGAFSAMPTWRSRSSRFSAASGTAHIRN